MKLKAGSTGGMNDTKIYLAHSVVEAFLELTSVSREMLDGGPRTMRLIHAAKYDVPSMILQNKKLFKFNRNIEKSDGKGPSQGMQISCDRGEQCRIGEDFVDILSDDEALEQEANEADNPTWFLPKRKTKHRPPATKFTLPPENKNTSKDPPKKKQRTGNKRKKDDINEVPLDACEDTCNKIQ